MLVSATYTFKVADFGLGRQAKEGGDYYRPANDGPLPVRWCAPECLRDKKCVPCSSTHLQ